MKHRFKKPDFIEGRIRDKETNLLLMDFGNKNGPHYIRYKATKDDFIQFDIKMASNGIFLNFSQYFYFQDFVKNRIMENTYYKYYSSRLERLLMISEPRILHKYIFCFKPLKNSNIIYIVFGGLKKEGKKHLDILKKYFKLAYPNLLGKNEQIVKQAFDESSNSYNKGARATLKTRHLYSNSVSSFVTIPILSSQLEDTIKLINKVSNEIERSISFFNEDDQIAKVDLD